VNSLKTAKAALNMAMGRDLGSPVEISDTFVTEPFDVPLDDVVAAAKSNRPDLAAMSHNMDGLEASKNAERAGFLPSLNFIGRYDIDQEEFLGGGGESYTLLGVATWNVFDGMYTTSSVDAAGAKYLSARHSYDSMSDGVEFEVRRAYYSLEEAGLRIAAASGSVDEGEESLRIIRRRFEAGLARSIDVLDAETALTRARTNRANALYDYNVSLVKLRLAAGILSPSDYGEDDDK
jgi:outer membrane protein TolC